MATGNSPGKVVLNGNLTLDPGAMLDFDLDGVSDSGLVLMPGNLLTLGGQDLSSMDFTVEPGFGAGTYTLIAAQAVSGGVGPSDSGTIDGLPVALSIEGSNLVLTVVPDRRASGFSGLLRWRSPVIAGSAATIFCRSGSRRTMQPE